MASQCWKPYQHVKRGKPEPIGTLSFTLTVLILDGVRESMPAQAESFPNSNSTFPIPLPPGALLLAQQFLPKHKLSIQAVCPVLDLSRDGFYKRLRNGKLDLKISKDEYGKQFVRLSDLIVYFYPEVSESLTAMPSEPSREEKRKRGRPPGSGNKHRAPFRERRAL